MEKIKYTWQDFDADVKKIERELKPFVPFIKNIYAIPRGGLILGVTLSHHLGLPLIQDEDKVNDKTLVVDDIVDKGDTLRDFITTHKLFKTASLIWCAKEPQPSFYARKKVTNEWVIFPWETEKSSKN